MKKISQTDIEKDLITLTQQLLVESGEQYKREIKLEASLTRHLGLDSLARAELFRRIEKQWDVSMPDHLLAEVETLNDILNYLKKASPRLPKKIHREILAVHEERSTVNPLQANSLVEVLLLYGEYSPNKTHLYFQDEEGKEKIITYGELLRFSLQAASGLKQRGLREGETVAIMLPTSPDFFYIFFGVLLSGGIPVPIYPPFRAHMLEAYAKTEARILQNAEVRILVTFDQAEKLSYLLQAFVPSLKAVTTADELLKSTLLITPFKPTADHFAFIQYTSGSTSDPKGVLLTHQNLLANIRAYGKAIQVTPDDVAVSWLPLYHDLGLIGMWLGSLYHGIPLVLMTPFSFLNRPERWLWNIHYHRGTLSGAPNFAYELCLRKIEPAMIEGLDLSSWRMAANGAEKIYPRTLQQFAEKFAPYQFKKNALLPVYGLAESTVGLTISPLGREFRIDRIDRKQFEEKGGAEPSTDKNALEFVSCGMPLEGHEVRIVDEEGQGLPERRVGNLQFRGPSSMQGYYNNPRATQAVYHNGWIDTGDLAYLAEKELFITGRKKDLIIKAGRNLYPAEIEEIVGNVASIRQGCVTAFAHHHAERGTEQLVVVAETREKNKHQREKIIADIKEAISTALEVVPDQVILVSPRTVPKTSSGKLQRAACKKLYIEGQLNKSPLPPWLQVIKLGAQWLLKQCLRVGKTLIKFIYTAYVLLILLLTLLPLYLIVRFASRTIAAKCCQIWARMLPWMVFCPVKVEGSSRLKEMSPAIYAANHASYVDIMVVLAVMPTDTRFVGKKELFTTPILRTFMKKLNYLSLDRTDLPKGLEDTKHIEAALKAGHHVFIFPEGTFGYAGGLRPFRLGTFKIAAETSMPVYPIALKGTRSILRADEKLMRPGRITMTICEPIYPQGTEWEFVIELRNKVRTEIAKYCGEDSLDFIAAQTVAPRAD